MRQMNHFVLVCVFTTLDISGIIIIMEKHVYMCV